MVDDIIKLKRDRAKQFGIARRNVAGISGAVTTGGANRSGSNNNNNNVSALQTAGGTMIGPLAFFRSPSTSVYPTAGNSHTLDISAETGAHSSHYIWPTGGSNQMDTISGAKHAGQILVIESTETLTQTIRDTSASGGNIKTLDGNSVVLGTSKTLVLFMYSDIDTSWHQVTNPVVAVGGGGGMNQDLSNMTAPTAPTVDLNMNNNDIIGIANLDLDGVTATIEGVRNLNFYSGHSINDLTDMLYQAAGTNAHRFLIGGVAKVDITNAQVEVRQDMDMNNNQIVSINKLVFNNDVNDNITSDTTGITYNVNLTDEHFFKVGGNTIMTVDHGEVLFNETINIGTGVTGSGITMDNTNISEIAALQFNTSGQSISSSASELLYQVPGGDTHAFYVAAAKTLEITDTYLEMQTNRYIDFGANITLTANAGFASLPANPLGFIKCRVNGGDARIPYYNV